MRRIRLVSPKYGTKYLLIDDDDFKKVNKYHWCMNLCRGIFYAVNTTWIGAKPKSIKVHRLIMKVLKTPLIFIDHKDRNGLNCQKSNLRKSNFSQNACNTKFVSKSKSGYRGVHLFKGGKMAGKYQVRINCPKKRGLFGGYFNNPIDAAKKYNELAIKHHGEFARLNTIPA